MKRFIQNALLSFGAWIVKVREDKPEDLRKFFSEMTPVSTNHNLIRLGGDGDGGYLIPDDLSGIRTCFSPGVSNVAGFERDLNARNIKCYLADYSVEAAPLDNSLIVFEKKFLGTENNPMFMTLDKWVADNADADDEDLILQMDIEGAEYDVLFGASAELLKRFRIIVIEFHYLDEMLTQTGFKLINGVFGKLLKSFEIVHIHPNNYDEPIEYKAFSIPPVMEFTFLRRDRISRSTPTKSFPHELDRPNSVLDKDYPLPRCWFSATG